MTNAEIKTSLHQLIDSIDDESQLAKAYRLIETLSTVNEDGALWSGLSPKEQKELMDIEKESHDTDSLISHEEMKLKHKKWL